MCRSRRAAMRFEREGIKHFAREAMFFNHHLRARKLAEHDAGIFLFEARRLIITQSLFHVEHHCRAHRHARHAFDARRNDDVLRSRHDSLRSELH